MTYTATHSSTTAATLDQTRAALDRASATLDRLDARSEARRVRSLALARAAGAGPWSVTFKSLEVGRDGWPTRVVVAAPSASLPFVAHRVTVELRTAQATCDCVAASFGRPCRHAGAALFYGREVVKAYAEAQAAYAAERRAEDRAAALAPSL